MDCLPASQMFCIPSAYEAVWEVSGQARRVGINNQTFVISNKEVIAAGARIRLPAKDLFTIGPIVGMYEKTFGARRVFYTADCLASTCSLGFIVAPTKRIVEGANTTTDIIVIGRDRAGLDTALRAISLKLPGESAGVSLATFVRP